MVNQSGRLIKMDSSGQVLGDEDKGQKQEQNIESKNEIRKDEQKTEIKEKKKEEIKERIEIKQGEKKREFESKGIKIKMEQKNGELKIKTKNEATGEETELETKIKRKERPEMKEPREAEEPAEPIEPQEVKDQPEPEEEKEIMRVREREDKNEVRINSKNGEFVIGRNNVGATTNFPLTIDSQTNVLTVTTPSGEKQVTTLPDQAVQNMLVGKVIDTVNGQNTGNSSGQVKITQKSDGSLVYEIEGERRKKLFGLMPLKFKKTAVVSVETGALVETKESFPDKLLELISF